MTIPPLPLNELARKLTDHIHCCLEVCEEDTFQIVDKIEARPDLHQLSLTMPDGSIAIVTIEVMGPLEILTKVEDVL